MPFVIFVSYIILYYFIGRPISIYRFVYFFESIESILMIDHFVDGIEIVLLTNKTKRAEVKMSSFHYDIHYMNRGIESVTRVIIKKYYYSMLT